jgi:hypothetical protein
MFWWVFTLSQMGGGKTISVNFTASGITSTSKSAVAVTIIAASFRRYFCSGHGAGWATNLSIGYPGRLAHCITFW